MWNWVSSGWHFLPLQQNALFHVHCCVQYPNTKNLEAVRHSLNISIFEIYHRILRLVEEHQGNIFREGDIPIVMIPSHFVNWPWLWCTLLYSRSLTVSLAMDLFGLWDNSELETSRNSKYTYRFLISLLEPCHHRQHKPRLACWEAGDHMEPS